MGPGPGVQKFSGRDWTWGLTIFSQFIQDRDQSRLKKFKSPEIGIGPGVQKIILVWVRSLEIPRDLSRSMCTWIAHGLKGSKKAKKGQKRPKKGQKRPIFHVFELVKKLDQKCVISSRLGSIETRKFEISSRLGPGPGVQNFFGRDWTWGLNFFSNSLKIGINQRSKEANFSEIGISLDPKKSIHSRLGSTKGPRKPIFLRLGSL